MMYVKDGTLLIRNGTASWKVLVVVLSMGSKFRLGGGIAGMERSLAYMYTKTCLWYVVEYSGYTMNCLVRAQALQRGGNANNFM
jgi:hypothetical protein